MIRKMIGQAGEGEPSVFDQVSIGNRKNISEELFEQLRDAILNGSLPAGYVFTNENEFCQKLNIGRGSLREAYASLETLHLITRSKIGTYVNAPDEIQNSMNFETIAQNTDARVLSEYRTIIEVGCAKLAAQKASERDIQKLESILKSMKSAVDDPEKLSQYDFDFHSALVGIAQNSLLLIAMNTIRSIYEDFTERVFANGYTSQSFTDHQAIVDALRAKDVLLAEQMMQRHLDHVEKFRDIF